MSQNKTSTSTFERDSVNPDRFVTVHWTLLERARFDLQHSRRSGDFDSRIVSDLAAAIGTADSAVEYHGLDGPDRVCFYEQDFYVLSNFSSFQVRIWGVDFATSEHAYHYAKFAGVTDRVAKAICKTRSAHDAFKLAEIEKPKRRGDWDVVKVDYMRDILRAKVEQHDYVRRKLLATGARELVENSWRDDFWGWGPSRNGRNMLGKLWMEIRSELRSSSSDT